MSQRKDKHIEFLRVLIDKEYGGKVISTTSLERAILKYFKLKRRTSARENLETMHFRGLITDVQGGFKINEGALDE